MRLFFTNIAIVNDTFYNIFAIFLCKTLLLSQHVDGLPGGGRGSHRVEGPDGDVSDREAAQTGENVSRTVVCSCPDNKVESESKRLRCVCVCVCL